MSSLTRLVWFLPLVAACGSTSVREEFPDGGYRSTGGAGARPVIDEDGGGAVAGGRTGNGGSPGTGSVLIGDGGFVGAGGFAGTGGYAAGGYFGTGSFFGGDGGFIGAGGDFFTGGWWGAGGIVEAGGSFSTGGIGGSGSAFGTGGRLVDPACCEAIPFCRAGYDQVSGPGECVKGDICYEATACCSTIWCKAHADQDAGACAAEAPPGVHYVSANASVCDRRAWTCPANTYQYWDTCGCGCSQDPSCPASVDCSVLPKDPLCTDTATCPYTTRD